MNMLEFLEQRQVEFNLIEHPDTFDAQHLAAAIHVSGSKVAKTVLLRADGGYGYVVAVLPASKTIDFERASQVLGGSKLELATEDEISERCPDCEFGVLPPFGSQYALRTIVDEELAQGDEIVFDGNTHHEAIRMKFSDFKRIEEPMMCRFATKS